MITRRMLGGAILAGGLYPGLARADGVLDRVRSAGRLRIGGVAAQAPYSEKDVVTGEWRGFMIDMARSLARQLNVSLDVVETNWGNAVLDVLSDKVDIFYGMNPTPQRAAVVDFTKPFFTNAFALIARPGFAPTNWTSLNDPAVRIAVQVGTSYDSFVAEQFPRAEVTRLQTANEATLQVQSGKADCQVIVIVLALTILTRNPAIGHVVMPQPLFGPTTNAIVKREPGGAWLATVNDWIDRARASGEVRDIVLHSLQQAGVKPADIPPQVVF